MLVSRAAIKCLFQAFGLGPNLRKYTPQAKEKHQGSNISQPLSFVSLEEILFIVVEEERGGGAAIRSIVVGLGVQGLGRELI